MAFSGLSKSDFTALRCIKCKCYLSCHPITANLDGIGQGIGGYNCGRCVPLIDQQHPMVTIYETLAQHLKFPCKFDSFGCTQQVKFNAVLGHEAHCGFRTIKCPVEGCGKIECIKNIQAHFASSHPDLLIKNAKFHVPQRKDVEAVRLLDHDGLSFLLQVRTRFGDKSGREFDLALRYFMKFPNADSYTYCVKISSTENTKSLTIDKHQIGLYQPDWSYPKQDVVSLDFNSLQTLLGCSNFFFEVFVDKAEPVKKPAADGPTKKDKSAKKDQTAETGAGTSQEHKPKKGKNAAAASTRSNGAGATSVLKKDSLLDDLECIVCKEYMKPPIFICTTGHSICSVCRKFLQACPTCQGKYSGTRNFQLEDIADRVNFPCKYKPLGCTVSAKVQEIALHEMQCRFDKVRKVDCPLSSVYGCSWEGQVHEIYSHARKDHRFNTWLRFNEPMQYDLQSKILRTYLVAEFDNNPFVVEIFRENGDAIIRVCLKDVGLATSAQSAYNFSLVLSFPNEFSQMHSRDLETDVETVISRKLFGPLLGIGTKLHFMIKATKKGR